MRLPSNFGRSLAAVLLGNAAYLLVEPYLPLRGRHQPFQIDWGLAVDFWFCLVAYGLLGFVRRRP